MAGSNCWRWYVRLIFPAGPQFVVLVSAALYNAPFVSLGLSAWRVGGGG